MFSFKKGIPKNLENLDAKSLENMQMLVSQLEEKSPISPYNFFGLNNSCFIKVLGTISTYIVILAQFKLLFHTTDV